MAYLRIHLTAKELARRSRGTPRVANNRLRWVRDYVTSEAIVVTAGQGIARAEKMLEALAAVESTVRPNYEALRRLVQGYRDGFSACICVFPAWSGERAAFLRRLVEGGLEVIGLVVCRDVEAVQEELAGDPVPCRCILLEHGKVQEGLMKL